MCFWLFCGSDVWIFSWRVWRLTEQRYEWHFTIKCKETGIGTPFSIWLLFPAVTRYAKEMIKRDQLNLSFYAMWREGWLSSEKDPVLKVR